MEDQEVSKWIRARQSRASQDDNHDLSKSENRTIWARGKTLSKNIDILQKYWFHDGFDVLKKDVSEATVNLSLV